MIDLYSWPTPNGQKIHIMLEETGLEYRVTAVDITAGEQFASAFLAISPNNRIPAMVDHDGPDKKALAVFESGAMLIYLAEKAGCFLPTVPGPRSVVLQWLMFQMGGIGPMFGQQSHFNNYAPQFVDAAQLAYSQKRYDSEVARLYGVLDRRLATSAYVGGEQYSIADMAIFPWVRGHRRRGIDITDYPNFARWLEELKARPAVRRGIDLLSERSNRLFDGLRPETIDNMFGENQFRRR